MTSPTPRRGRTGRAFVEIIGDTSKFGPDLEKKINAALRDVGVRIDFGPITDAAGKGGAQAGTRFAADFDRQARAGVRSTGKAAANEVVVSMASAAVLPGNRARIFHAFAHLGSIAARAASGVASSIGSSFLNVAEGVGGGIMNFFSRIGSNAIQAMSMSIATFLIQAGLLIVIIPTLIGFLSLLIIQLVGLAGIVNALPAGLTVLLAAILPLVVAFQGFGETIGAIMEGDAEKFEKSLKNLTPSARAVAREFKALMPFFTELRKIAQENLFAPLVGGLRDVFAVIGPEVRQGMVSVASAWGRLLASVMSIGTSPVFKDLLRDLFGSGQTGERAGAVARILDRLSPAITRLLDAFVRASDAGLPTVEKLFDSLARILESIANTTNEAIADGSFQEWLDDAVEIGGLLWDLLKELWNTLTTLFQGTKDEGKDFLRDIIEAIQDLNAWLESPEGRDALNELIRLAQTFLEILKLVIGALGDVLAWLGRVDQTVDFILGKLPKITGISSGGVASAIAAGARAVRGYAEGGIIAQPTFGLIGEAGPEAVVPLNNPQRAAEVMSAAGLLPLGSMLDAGNMIVQVFLGTREITDILDTRVRKGLAATGRALAAGARPVGGV